MATLVYGTELSPSARREALSKFIGRFTRDHMPWWAQNKTKKGYYPCQFKSDEEWLDNTEFHVTKSGNLDRRFCYCISHPTWPDGMTFKEEEPNV